MFQINVTDCRCNCSRVITAAVGELEACKLQHLATIEDLQKDLIAAKQRSAELEQNKQTLEADQRLKSSEQDNKLQTLQNVNSFIDIGFVIVVRFSVNDN